MQWDEAIHGS
uniref:ENOD40 n=1 Tax=Solanum lycopersicum TaxID=4081 RepID=Q6TS30_SOLLC|nr:RecName: Full=Early nodulin-40 homolog [Nicotiana tabacum]AAQ90471.1 ENOD40 [Solanum lycopersicum]CAA67267.1 ENOD40 [Nicotiana tabacum]